MIHKVHIIGLGLMGTNLGIKLVNKGVSVSGEDLLEKNILRAKKYKAINSDVMIDSEYDLTILAMPISEIIKYLEYGKSSVDSKVLLDIGGTKKLICNKMDIFLTPSIGGHPLCGVADNKNWNPNPEMFIGAPFLLCETKTTNEFSKEIINSFVDLIESKKIWIDSEKHDELISLTSHLPHLLSSALVSLAMKEQDMEEILDLASGGFDGSTRLSRTSPNMIADMYITNSKNVKNLIKNLISELEIILNINNEDIMMDYLSKTVDWRRALTDKFGERELN